MSTNHDGPKPTSIAGAGYPRQAEYGDMKVPHVLQNALNQATAGTTLGPTSCSEPGYEVLQNVLYLAYSQAAHGKGQERHARQGEGFENQPIFDMARRFGVGSLLAQAFKKMDESQRLGHAASQRELLGAIVYIAAAYIHNENQQHNV